MRDLNDLHHIPEAALSVRLPWTIWLAAGVKPVENRGRKLTTQWIARHPGPVFLHAGVWWDEREIAETIEEFGPIAARAGFKTPPLAEIKSLRGCLIGAARIVGCVEAMDSPWFFGPFGWVMSDPVLLKTPVRCAGALSFFEVPEPIRRAVRDEIAGRIAA